MKHLSVILIFWGCIQGMIAEPLSCYYNECTCNSKEHYYNPSPEHCHCVYPGYGKVEERTGQFAYCYETTVEAESRQVAYRSCREGNKKVPPKCQPGITGDKTRLWPNGAECWCSENLCNTQYKNDISK